MLIIFFSAKSSILQAIEDGKTEAVKSNAKNTESVSLGTFHSISAKGLGQIKLHQGKTNSYQNCSGNARLDIRNDTLFVILNKDKIRVRISELKAIDVAEEIGMKAEDMSMDSLFVTASGQSSLVFSKLNVKNIHFISSNFSRIQMKEIGKDNQSINLTLKDNSSMTMRHSGEIEFKINKSRDSFLNLH
jgi:hypothetical protein